MVEKITQVKSDEKEVAKTKVPVKKVGLPSTEEAPKGIKILSVLIYIGSVLLVLFGIIFIIMAITGFDVSSGGVEEWSQYAINSYILENTGTLFVIFGIVFLGLGVLYFFIARGLKRGKNWARVLILIFAILGFLRAIVDLVGEVWGAIINLVVDGLIIWYLIFKQNVKAFFGK